jgi:hypothetical protein
MFHSHQDGNLVPISKPQQEVMVETNKEMSTMAYNLHVASYPINNLSIAIDPSGFVHCSVLNTYKQRSHSHKFLAPTNSIHLTNIVSDPQEVFALGFQ